MIAILIQFLGSMEELCNESIREMSDEAIGWDDNRQENENQSNEWNACHLFII